MKALYEKPILEQISFVANDTLADEGDNSGGAGGAGGSAGVEEW